MNPEFTRFACDVVQRAGQRTLRHFRNAVQVERKESQTDFDPVTLADRECEFMLRREISRTWPDHGIIGEEYEDVNQGRYSWVIDPIDGTRAFISGLLHWGVLLALCEDNKPILGVMYQPFTEELFVGEATGSWYQRHQVRLDLTTRKETSLENATLMTTDPRLFQDAVERRAYQQLEQAVRLTRYGGDCYQYAMLAAGGIDLVCENDLKLWDILALIPIIQHAGGVITDWQGGDPTISSRILASGSARIHSQALEVLDFHA